MPAQQLKSLVMSSSSPFIDFLNSQTLKGGTINKNTVERKEFFAFNKLIKKLSKKAVIRIIKSNDKDVLIFEIV